MVPSNPHFRPLGNHAFLWLRGHPFLNAHHMCTVPTTGGSGEESSLPVPTLVHAERVGILAWQLMNSVPLGK